MNMRSLRTVGAWLILGIAGVYVLLCVLSLLLILGTGQGWFGLEPDAFVAIYAVALAVPWVFFIPDITILGSYAGLAAILLSMLANLALLLWLARLVRGARRVTETDV